MHLARRLVKNSARWLFARKHDPRFWRIAVMLLLISALGIRNIPRLLLWALENLFNPSCDAFSPSAARHPPSDRLSIHFYTPSEQANDWRAPEFKYEPDDIWNANSSNCEIELNTEHHDGAWQSLFSFPLNRSLRIFHSRRKLRSLARSDGKFRNVLFSSLCVWHHMTCRANEITAN